MAPRECDTCEYNSVIFEPRSFKFFVVVDTEVMDKLGFFSKRGVARACILILNRRYHIAEKIHPSAEEIWIFPLGRKNMEISPRQKKYRCPSRRLVNLLGYV